MSTIQIQCINKTLTIIDSPSIEIGGVNSLQFSFCPLWDGYTKTVHFYKNETDCNPVEIVNNLAEIPSGLVSEGASFFFFVEGISGELKRRSQIFKCKIESSLLVVENADTDIQLRLIDLIGNMDSNFSFDDLSDEDKEKFREGLSAYQKKFTYHLGLSAGISSFTLPDENYREGADIVNIHLNGIYLHEGLDYTLSGRTITLTNTIVYPSVAEVSIIRAVIINSNDYSLLKGEKGDQGIQGIQGIQGEKGDTPDISNIYTKSEVDNLIANAGGDVDLSGYLPLAGGTMEGELHFNGGDGVGASKISLGANGQITDASTSTLFGRMSGDSSFLYVGSSGYGLKLRGKLTRPLYNGSDMALKSDIPTSLPASDVYAWAKASSKPSYSASEVGASASGHTHSEYAPKPTYYQGTGTLSAMSVGEIRLVTISGGSSASFKLPSGGQYMVGGVEAYQDYTIENSVGLPFSGKYSGGASISVDGYGRWCIVLRIS